MKFILILLLPILSLAKPLVFEVCDANDSCYNVITPDAKSWGWKADYTGARFVRVYLYSGILDISAKNLVVKLKK